MANQVAIRVTAPGAKQAAADIAGVQNSMRGIGGMGASVKQGMGMAFGISTVGLISSAGSAVTDFVGDSIAAASNLNETLSKSKVIFGDNANEIEDWGETAAKAFGQSKRQAIDTASTFAGLFQTVGVAADESAARARELTERGSDLASFFNTDVKTAVESLRSGLSGEAEPMRKYNVFLSEAAVTAKLLALGEKKLGGEWTENQKIMGRYKIILEQTDVAAGDFANTSDGLANSTRTLNATMEDTSAQLGEKLLPVQKAVTQAQLDLATAAGTMFDAFDMGKKPLADQVQTVQDMALSAQTLFPWLGSITGGIIDQTEAAKDLIPVQEDLNDKARLLAGGYAAATVGTDDLADATDDLDTSADGAADGGLVDLEKQLKDTEKAADDAYEALDDLATEVLDDQYGPRIQSGRLLELQQDLKDAKEEQAKYIEGSKKWTIADGRVADYQQSIVELEGEIARAAGDPAYIEWLRTQINKLETAGGNAAAYRLELQKLTRTINGMPGLPGGGGGGMTRVRAAGGPVSPGLPYIVGEQRPEVFVPETGGRILPSVPSMGGGGGGLTVQVYIANMYGGPAGLDQLAQDLSGRLRQTVRGANYQAGRF